jgi:tetratricopeptide (TPR) repeat protein
MFKLGRFAEAEAFYGHAISALPEGHLLLVPLYNNRAAVRLKIGDHKGAQADCTCVLTLIDNSMSGGNFHPLKEMPIAPMDDGEVVSLADGYVKALQRRAWGFESGEKWESAKADWEHLVGVDWLAGVRLRQEAIRGIGRCRKMLDGGGTGETHSSLPRQPKPQTLPVQRLSSLGEMTNSEAVSRLRAAADSQEAEDVERSQIKDAVDAKLLAWKGGKENNLRALIASLDTVLWPDLGWTKVGMSELVTPGQVKVRYMRAIGRVHPDKVSRAFPV